MDIELLKTFLEVARVRHFGKASENLFLTQSAVSARIRQLEEDIGSPLFIRKRNDIQLTTTGDKFIPYAQSMLTMWGRAKHQVLLKDQNEIILSISSVIGLWDIFLQQWLEKLHASTLPAIVHADIAKVDVLQRKLLESTLDIAFTFDFRPSAELQIEQVACVPLILVSSTPDQTPEDAFENNYISIDWGTAFTIEIANTYLDLPCPRMHVALSKMAHSLIMNQGGTAYLPEPAVRKDITNNDLFIVKDAPYLERCAYAVFNPESDKIEIIKKSLAIFDDMQNLTFPDMSKY